MEAAQHWAASFKGKKSKDRSMLIEQMRALNAPPDIIERFEQKKAPELFDVWPENWPTVKLFLTVQTQWRYGPMGGVFGLDYTAIDVVFRYRKIEVTPAQFAGLQVMERAVLPILNEKTS